MTERLPKVAREVSGESGMERRIRVAVMLTPVEFGGAERVCLTLLKHVNRQRFDVAPILLTRPWEKDNMFIRELKAEGYEPREIPVALQETGDHLRVARCYRLAWKLLKNGGFDLLHTHGYFADIVGIPVARLSGVPTLSTCHGYIPSTWNVRLYNAIDRMTLRFGTQVLAVSEGIRRELIGSGVSEHKIRVVVNAVSPVKIPDVAQSSRKETRRSHGLSDDDFVAGYIGRLSSEKGLNHFLAACVALVNDGMPLKVLIVGDGPQRTELETLARRLGLEDRINFAGFQEDVSSWLTCMDAFVLPSLTEGTPMALLEAMTHGIAVVASAVGGVPQVIKDGETGLLVPAGDVPAISSAVRRLYEDPGMRRSLAERACDLAGTRYGVSEWIGQIEAAYRSLSK